MKVLRNTLEGVGEKQTARDSSKCNNPAKAGSGDRQIG